jgi:hypothetical protein
MTLDDQYEQWAALEDERSRLWAEQQECIAQINKKWTPTHNPPLDLIDKSQQLADKIQIAQQKIKLLFDRTANR